MLRLLAGMPVSSTRAGANQRAVDERPPALDNPDGAAQGGPRSRADARGPAWAAARAAATGRSRCAGHGRRGEPARRSEEHTSELQSRLHLVCRLLLEKKKKTTTTAPAIASQSCRVSC